MPNHINTNSYALKLYTRTWARSVSGSKVTTYTYDSNTGEMTQVNYSDDTPDVT